MSRLTEALPDDVFRWLQSGRPGLLITEGEDGYPGTAHTWCAAAAPDRLRFGADSGSATIANLERSPHAALQLIGDAGVYLVKGAVHMLKDHVEASPFPMALMEMKVESVKDQSWPGVNVRPLAYDWDPEHREQMTEVEQAVYAEMRTADSEG